MINATDIHESYLMQTTCLHYPDVHARQRPPAGPGLVNWAETPEEIELEELFQKKGPSLRT